MSIIVFSGARVQPEEHHLAPLARTFRTAQQVRTFTARQQTRTFTTSRQVRTFVTPRKRSTD